MGLLASKSGSEAAILRFGPPYLVSLSVTAITTFRSRLGLSIAFIDAILESSMETITGWPDDQGDIGADFHDIGHCGRTLCPQPAPD